MGGPPADNSTVTIHTATDEKLAETVAEQFEFTTSQTKKWKELTGEKVGFDRQRVSNRCSSLFAQLLPDASTLDTQPALTPPTPPAAGPQPQPPLPPPGIVGQPPGSGK